MCIDIEDFYLIEVDYVVFDCVKVNVMDLCVFFYWVDVIIWEF